ncbi:MAG: hypothetical protein F6J95_005890 [Leptolyngbya sp. SIO1E4]|nr:hypothetical protein [Leptolyngbya sp. SIO1E4]
MKNLKSVYAVYVSPLAIELRSKEQAALAHGRLVCKQTNYSSILRFARNLALHHRLPLHNYVQAEA